VPTRLRPTAPFAADAILVGDPGRALLLAQELLEQPKMSNHARGLWGYSGRTPGGAELTIQATGMGGPSAAIVLADLAKLGVTRVVRVGTCAAVGDQSRMGELLLPTEAIAAAGSAAAFGLAQGESAQPDASLLDRLTAELGSNARACSVASLDSLQPGGIPTGVVAADMQTVAVFARGRELGLIAAAILIVSEAGGKRLADDELESAAKLAGRAAVKALSKAQLEG
jgi:purine-nucleoside phosphorylase